MLIESVVFFYLRLVLFYSKKKSPSLIKTLKNMTPKCQQNDHFYCTTQKILSEKCHYIFFCNVDFYFYCTVVYLWLSINIIINGSLVVFRSWHIEWIKRNGAFCEKNLSLNECIHIIKANHGWFNSFKW